MTSARNWRTCETCQLQFHVICAEQLRENAENVSVKNCGCADVNQIKEIEQKPVKEVQLHTETYQFKIGDEVAVIIDERLSLIFWAMEMSGFVIQIVRHVTDL